jgi:hypothetical protein
MAVVAVIDPSYHKLAGFQPANDPCCDIGLDHFLLDAGDVMSKAARLMPQARRTVNRKSMASKYF